MLGRILQLQQRGSWSVFRWEVFDRPPSSARSWLPVILIYFLVWNGRRRTTFWHNELQSSVENCLKAHAGWLLWRGYCKVCIGIGIDFYICPWSYGPVSEPLFSLLIHNPHWPCWSKKRKHNYQKNASSRNAIRSITFMNYAMKEYTNLSYMSRWEGVLLQRLNEIDIDNTPGTHPDTCHIDCTCN